MGADAPEPNPYVPPAAAPLPAPEPEVAREVATDGPRGIGGWLLLPILGLVLTPVRAGITIGDLIEPLIDHGIGNVMADDPDWFALAVAQISMNGLLALLACAGLFFLYLRSRHFPRAMIALYAVNALFFVGNRLVETRLGWWTDADVVDREVIRAVGGAAIWIPYFLLSKRVRNTFGAARRVAMR